MSWAGNHPASAATPSVSFAHSLPPRGRWRGASRDGGSYARSRFAGGSYSAARGGSVLSKAGNYPASAATPSVSFADSSLGEGAYGAAATEGVMRGHGLRKGDMVRQGVEASYPGLVLIRLLPQLPQSASPIASLSEGGGAAQAATEGVCRSHGLRKGDMVRQGVEASYPRLVLIRLLPQLPQSASLTAPSGREPMGVGFI